MTGLADAVALHLALLFAAGAGLVWLVVAWLLVLRLLRVLIVRRDERGEP